MTPVTQRCSFSTATQTKDCLSIGTPISWLCIKPVTEPNRTEPTEITEHIRPNLRKLSNIRTGPMAIMIFRYRELTALPVKMTKILKFKHLFQYLQRILCNFTAKLSLMKDHKGLLFVYLFVLKYLYYNGVIVFLFLSYCNGVVVFNNSKITWSKFFLYTVNPCCDA